MSIRSTIRGYATDTGRAFDRAPIECVMAVFMAFCISYTIEHKGSTPTETAHLVVGALMVLLMAWAATLRAALGYISTNRRWAETLIGAGLGAAYLLVTHNFDHEVEGWRAFVLISGIALLVFAAPALGVNAEAANLRLRRINGRFFIRAVGTALYGLALFAGLAVALAAVDNLFELDLDEDLYFHTYTWIMLVLVPWVIVGGLDDYVRPIEEKSDVSRVIHKMATFLVPPLVALYFAILCLYVVRIAVTHELPQNLVSPMVIAAGILGCLALIVFDPDPDAPLGRRWLRYTPVVFVPLAPLAMWALVLRVSDYGWTEFRLLRFIALIALLLLALLAITQLVKRRAYAIRFIPLVLGASLLMSAFIVPTISKRDQQQRLIAAMRSAGVDPAQLPADTTRRVIKADLYKRINSSAGYLERHFGIDALRAVVPGLAPNDPRGPVLAVRYNLVPDESGSDSDYYYSSLAPDVPVQIPNAVAYRIQVPQRDSAKHSWLAGDTLFTNLAGDTLYMDLTSAVEALRIMQGRTPFGTPTAVPASDRGSIRRGTFIVLDMNANTEKGRRRLSNVSGILLIDNR